MKRHHFSNRLVFVLAVITAFLATSCAPAPATEAPPAIEPPTKVPVATEPPVAEPTTTLAPATFELSLPDFTDKGKEQILGQVDQFMGQNPDVIVNVSFTNYSQLITNLNAMAESGQPPGMAALDSSDVPGYVQREHLLPLGEPANFDAHRDDMIQSITIDEQVYGYPWRGVSACRTDSLNVVVFQNNSPEVVDAARRLGEFLIDFGNQLSNLENPDLSWYPTLNQIYADRGIVCTVVNTEDSALIAEAQAKAATFSGNFGVEIDASKAVGLDAVEVGGEPGTLASAMAPAVDDGNDEDNEPSYNGRLVLGYLSVDHPNIANFTGLPVGEYLIGCFTESLTESRDCVAMPNPDEEIPINPGIIYIEPSNLEGPIAFYELGSIGGCFKVYDDVKVCVSLF